MMPANIYGVLIIWLALSSLVLAATAAEEASVDKEWGYIILKLVDGRGKS